MNNRCYLIRLTEQWNNMNTLEIPESRYKSSESSHRERLYIPTRRASGHQATGCDQTLRTVVKWMKNGILIHGFVLDWEDFYFSF